MAFVQNNIRAAPIWDSQRLLFTGLLTVTDLIRLLIEHVGEDGSPKPEEEENKVDNTFDSLLNLPLHQRQRRDSPKHSGNGGNSISNHLIYALGDEK